MRRHPAPTNPKLKLFFHSWSNIGETGTGETRRRGHGDGSDAGAERDQVGRPAAARRPGRRETGRRHRRSADRRPAGSGRHQISHRHTIRSTR